MAQLDIGSYFGLTFVLLCISFILYGFFCAQTFYYWRMYRDHYCLRFLVALVGLLETVHQAFCVHILYTYLIIDFADLAALERVIWSAPAVMAIQNAIIASVQSYNIYKIWYLSRNNIVVALLITLQLFRIAIVLRADAYNRAENSWIDELKMNSYNLFLNMGFILDVVTDTFITSLFMWYMFRKGQALAYTRSTKMMVTKLVYYSMIAGVLTTAVSVAELVAYNRSHDSLNFAGLLVLNGKLYANSILALLNARRYIRDASSKNGYSLEIGPLSMDAAPPSHPMTGIEIHQDNTAVATHDISGWMNMISFAKRFRP